jgi:hypothetical protein
MICALCYSDGELRLSHVIPEFMYASLYDDKHRFHILSDKQRSRYAQKGQRETLLCDRCEQRFSVYERYVSLLMNGGIPLEYETRGRLIIIRGVDYKALRMFQLSVLWRAGVSTLPFFSQVSLGQHQERIRKLLFDDDPGVPWQYGCLMYALIYDGRVQEDLVVQPTPSRLDDVPCYRFIFGGHAWLYLVASHQHAKKLETASLDPSGELRLAMKSLGDLKYVADFGRTLVEQGKL